MARVTFDFPFEVGDTDLARLGVMEADRMAEPTHLDVPQDRLVETLQALATLGFKGTTQTT